MKDEVKDDLSVRNSKKVEFTLERGFIEEKIALGHALRSIWRALHDAGRVTMSYEMFVVLSRSMVAKNAQNGNSDSGDRDRVAAQKSAHGPSIRPNSSGKELATPRFRDEGGPRFVYKGEKPKPEINLCTIGKEYLIETCIGENESKTNRGALSNNKG